MILETHFKNAARKEKKPNSFCGPPSVCQSDKLSGINSSSMLTEINGALFFLYFLLCIFKIGQENSLKM